MRLRVTLSPWHRGRSPFQTNNGATLCWLNQLPDRGLLAGINTSIVR
jgi:hypothetical protein